MKAEKGQQGRGGEVSAVPAAPARPNRLIREASPYLQQHAYNPVDWYPWGPEAFERAAAQNRPVLLSIGYSACHWCHVMERESFADEEVAGLVNNSFVAIKVDREERPEIDGVYMAFCHAMGGSCGWPLTVIMTPGRKPFYVTSYVPRHNRQGQAGIVTLLSHIRDLWAERGERVVESAEHLAAIVGSKVAEQGVEHVDESAIDAAFHDLEASFDRETGGFGGAPKFPMATTLMFLLRYWRRTGNSNALQMAERTLQAMRRGGIFDQLGWGFHRYATDSAWLVPHYEKMLYDQALLAMTYAETFQATGDPQYETVAREVLAYVERDLRAPGGGFFSAEDAESEGMEGKFYLWDERDLRRALTPEEASLAAGVFGVKKTGNFIESASGYMPGQNILHVARPIPAVASDLGISEEDLRARVERIRQKLYAHRGARARPVRDEKVLTDWNGLMIAALSVASQALDEPAYAAGAARAADFVLKNLKTADGRLLHRWRDGAAGIDGTAGDYAYMVWGLIELYEATLQVRWLREALDLNARMHRDFWDPEGGGFFTTAQDAAGLPLRLKELYDSATPSANAAGFMNTLRLARLTADADLETKALTMIGGLGASVLRYPSSHGWLLAALDFHVRGSLQVVVSGREDADDTRKLLAVARSRFIPEKVLLLRPWPRDDHEITRIAEYTRTQVPRGGKATAYVCHNYACALPTTSAEEMLSQLKGAKW